MRGNQFQPKILSFYCLHNDGIVTPSLSYVRLSLLMQNNALVFFQGVKVGTLGRQNERNSSYVRLAHTSIFGLCFMLVCLMKSNCYSLIYSSLGGLHDIGSCPSGVDDPSEVIFTLLRFYETYCNYGCLHH